MPLHTRTVTGVAAVACLALATAGVVPALAADSASSATTAKAKTKTLVKTLVSPKGITLDGAGNVVIAQNGLGEPGKGDAKLAKYYTSGKDKGELKLFGKKRTAVAIAHSPKGGYWSLGGNGRIY